VYLNREEGGGYAYIFIIISEMFYENEDLWSFNR
jgi:hypothetical protein